MLLSLDSGIINDALNQTCLSLSKSIVGEIRFKLINRKKNE